MCKVTLGHAKQCLLLVVKDYASIKNQCKYNVAI